jgi:hypothetical protein
MLRNILFACLIFLFFSDCKKVTGPAGYSSLINIVPESAGANCTNGGLKISSGLDKNRNQILDENEIESQSYICNGSNGADGLNSLFDIQTENSGGNCGNGGYKLMSGLDENRNGLLDPKEIKNTLFICNGDNMLVSSVYENPGANCANGGFKLTNGYDGNGNGVLDESEITTTQYICNGEDGLNDKLTRIEIPLSNGNITEGSLIFGMVIKFNKNDYATDSIVFVAAPYTNGEGNTATVELYDLTDNQVITKSILSSNQPYENSVFQLSQNIYASLPDKEISLGIKLSDDVNGQIAASGLYNTMIFVYKK